LEVVSDTPGAEVTVDGVRAGVTPLRLDLVVGSHSVRVSQQGGAPVVKDVTVQEGVTLRVEATVGSGPPRPQTATLGTQTPPEGQTTGAPKAPGLPGREFFSTFFEQPWAWAAAGICGVSLLVAALLWTTSSPTGIPFVGSYLTNLPGSDNASVWLGVKMVALVVAAASGLLALGLFVWPTLPFAKFVALPELGKMLGKKDEKKEPQETSPSPGS
jgi:hypothetical protein